MECSLSCMVVGEKRDVKQPHMLTRVGIALGLIFMNENDRNYPKLEKRSLEMQSFACLSEFLITFRIHWLLSFKILTLASL